MDSGTLCKPVVRNSLEQEKYSCLQGRVSLRKPATQGPLSGCIVVNKVKRILQLLISGHFRHCADASQ